MHLQMTTGMSPSNGFHSSHPSPSPEGPIRPLSPSLDFAIIDSDDGHPTDDLHADLLRVLQLIHSERHLVALTLFLSVEERLKNDLNLSDEEKSLESHENEPDGMSIPLSPSTRRTFLHHATLSRRKKNTSKDMGTDNHHLYRQRISALKLMRDKQEEFDVLKKRCSLFQRAKTDQNNEGWIFSQTLFGASTFYRREPDGTLTMRIEGELNDVPLFEQLAVLREVELFHCWAPFCSGSRNLAQLGNIDMIGYLFCGSTKFGLSRDVCFRVIGCDSLREDGKVIVVAEGIGDVSGDNAAPNESGGNNSFDMSFLSSDPIINNIDIPPIPTRFGSGRMTLRRFEAIIDVLSPSSARTRIISNVDPNISFIPHALLDFIMRKMCGVLLYQFQNAATKLSRRPDSTPYAERIRLDPFYKDWLVPKFKHYCDFMGWKYTSIQIRDSPNLKNGEILSATADESSSPVLYSGDSQMAPRSIHSHDENQQTLNSPQSQTSSNLFAKRRMKKELERAQSRELILNSLRPTPFREEQLSRLKLLREVREKVLTSSSSGLTDSDYKISGNIWEILLYPSHLEALFTGATPQLPHKLMIASYLFIMFFVFFAMSDEKTFVFDISKDLHLLYWPLRLLQLTSFSMIYYLLMNRTLVAIFDTIELPGTSTISNEIALASSRKLFIRFTRSFCQYLLGFILLISFTRGGLWYILVALMSRKRAPHMQVLDQKTVDGITWDSIAVEHIKWFMSYSAVFIISLLNIANYITPGRKLKST